MSLYIRVSQVEPNPEEPAPTPNRAILAPQFTDKKLFIFLSVLKINVSHRIVNFRVLDLRIKIVGLLYEYTQYSNAENRVKL